MQPATNDPTAVIEIEHLTKRYGDFAALSELSLSVQRGELFALLGPNGAGKTTSLRILMGFLRASAGSARVLGQDCFEERVALKSRIGYLPDEPVFYDYLRGIELIQFSGRMHGLSQALVKERAQSLTDLLGFGSELNDFAMNYSRGMKKKLALVCALLHEPELLILDEPTSGLDPLATRALNTLLLNYRERGTTILLSSHLLDQVEKLCDRLAIVVQGRVAVVGSPAELRRERASVNLEDLFFSVAGSAPEISNHGSP